MSQKALKKIDLLIVGYAVILCGGAAAFFGFRSFAGVATGAAIALPNWILSRWLGVKLILDEHKTRVSLLLALKMISLLGVILLILSLTSVDPVAFMIGLSTLVFGIFSEGIWMIVKNDN